MPLSASSLVVLNDTSNLTSYATASTTPSSGKLILCAVASSKASTPDLPTVSGCGLTWVQVATVLFDTVGTPTKRVTLFRALGTPSTGAITASFGGVQQTGCNIFVSEIGPVDPGGSNGADAVVQSATNAVDSATSLTVTLSAFGNSSNGAYGCEFTNLGTNSTVGSGFSLIARGGYSTPSHTGNTEFKSSEDTSVDWTFSSGNAGAIAIEVKLLVVSGSGAATLGHATAAGAVEQQFVASAGAALSRATGSGAAQEEFVAAAAGAIGAASSGAAGLIEIDGGAAAALSHASASGAAEVQVIGSGAAALAASSAAATAQLEIRAAAACALSPATTSGAGELAITGAVGAALGGASAAGAGSEQLVATGGAALSHAVASAVSELVIQGAGAAALGPAVAVGGDGSAVIIDTIRIPGRVRRVVHLRLRMRPTVRCDGRVARTVPLRLAIAGVVVVPARVRQCVLVGLDP